MMPAMVKPTNLVSSCKLQAILPLHPAIWYSHNGDTPQQAGAEPGRDDLW